ncbi:hypothetical protein Hanom_Chr15g01348681 [Helianthus anomalus]
MADDIFCVSYLLFVIFSCCLPVELSYSAVYLLCCCLGIALDCIICCACALFGLSGGL